MVLDSCQILFYFLNTLRMNRQILAKYCINIIIDKIYIMLVTSVWDNFQSLGP